METKKLCALLATTLLSVSIFWFRRSRTATIIPSWNQTSQVEASLSIPSLDQTFRTQRSRTATIIPSWNQTSQVEASLSIPSLDQTFRTQSRPSHAATFCDKILEPLANVHISNHNYVVSESCLDAKAGLGHTLRWYNNAMKLAFIYNLTYIFQEVSWGHYLPPNTSKIIGLDQHVVKSIPGNVQSVTNVSIRVDDDDASDARKWSHLKSTIDKTSSHGLYRVGMAKYDTSFALTSWAFRCQFWLARQVESILLAPHLDSNLNPIRPLIIGIHIRRGELLNQPYYRKRMMLNDEFYIQSTRNVLRLFSEVAPRSPVVVHIFSDGLKQTNYAQRFSDAVGCVRACEVHVTDGEEEVANTLKTMEIMTASDVLILSRSGFSQVMALYAAANAIKLYPPWRIPYRGIPNALTMGYWKEGWEGNACVTVLEKHVNCTALRLGLFDEKSFRQFWKARDDSLESIHQRTLCPYRVLPERRQKKKNRNWNPVCAFED